MSISLSDAIVKLGQKFITPDNPWYTWRINVNDLPEGVSLPHGGPYHQGVSLKQQLNLRWQFASDEKKVLLVDYYIRVWGGIKKNSPETINRYADQTPGQLIALGKKGIASWSKALCIRDPNRFAIYDARVAVALNALQVIDKIFEPQLFPLLQGRNTEIKSAPAQLRRYAGRHQWPRPP